MAKKKPSFSAVVSLMSDNTQARLESESRQKSDDLPLNLIRPDFSQPRNLLPDDLAEAVTGGQLTPQDAVREWINRAKVDVANPALQHNIRELKRLAESIEQHGLINPISVRAIQPDESALPEVAYLIVTGERRYWAHVYLLNEGKQIHEGDAATAPDQIKATVAAAGVSVKAHQLIENFLREDINAIERAHGIWALRYELSGVNHGSPLSDKSAEAPGVNHGSPDLVPWAHVEKTLGISKRYRIFAISVLKLCDEAQQLVAKYNLTERTIRPIVQKLKKRPDLQVKALEQLVAWQKENEADDSPGRSIVASVKELVEQLLAEGTETEEKETAKPTRSVSSEPVIRFRDKVRKTLDFLNRLKERDRANLNTALTHKEYADVMVDLRNLRQQIDKILEVTGEVQPEEDDISTE